MYKYLLFAEPKALVFYSSATAIDVFNDLYFATTKMRQLIFRAGDDPSSKSNLPLDKALKLKPRETINILKVLRVTWKDSVGNPGKDERRRTSKGNIKLINQIPKQGMEGGSGPQKASSGSRVVTLLMGTNKLNFFEILLDLKLKKIEKAKRVQFSYKSSLKRLSSNSKFVLAGRRQVLMVSSNFIFYYSEHEKKFRLLKLMREKIINVEPDYISPDTLYILTKKTLMFGKITSLNNNALAFKETFKEPNKRKFIGFKAMRRKLAFFNKQRQIRIFELDKQDFTYKIEIFRSFKTPFDFEKLHVVNGDILAIHDENYLYSLSLKMNRIWQIVNLSDSHFALLPSGEVISLRKQSENLFSVSQIKVKTYMKQNKVNKYLMLTPYERLKVVFAYLSRKFLKMFKFQDYNKVIYKLLLKMNLSNRVIKRPEFKPEVLKFYNLISHFSCKMKDGQHPTSMLACPPVPAKPLYQNASRRRSLQTLPQPSSSPPSSPEHFTEPVMVQPPDMESEISSTASTSPSKSRKYNYVVSKPYIDIRLPRKNSPRNKPDPQAQLKKIQLKGSAHYQKFLRFRSFDPYPKDSIDSVYARYQSRLQRIKLGKTYIRSLKILRSIHPKNLAGELFFITDKFNLKNNFNFLVSIFMGIDQYLWLSDVNRRLTFSCLVVETKKKVDYFHQKGGSTTFEKQFLVLFKNKPEFLEKFDGGVEMARQLQTDDTQAISL